MPASLLPSPNQPGLVAAWSLKFSHENDDHTLAGDNPKPVQFGSDDYDADITATLPSGLAGGTYTITVYGLSDEHYQAIATKRADDKSKELNAVQLFLYYADNAGVAGYFGNLIGLTSSDVPADALVADLRLKNVKRSASKPPVSGGSGAGSSGSGGSASGSSSGGAASGGKASSGSDSTGAAASGGSGSAAASGGSGGDGARLRPPTYQFVIEVEERIYNIIAGAQLSKDKPAPPPATTLQAAVDELLHNQVGLQAGTHYKYYPAQPEPAQNVAFQREATIGWQLAYLARSNGPLERANAPSSSGRGMLMIRDGMLHIGKRPIPLPKSTAAAAGPLPANPLGAATGGGQAAATTLNVSAGLLETTIAGTATASGTGGSSGSAGKSAHRQFTLLLRGRPDIKPGDVVKFKLPNEDAKPTTSSLGALAAVADIAKGLVGIDETPDASLYVETVEHKLGRRSGFQTTLTGVEIQGDGGDTAWDSSGEGTKSSNAASGPAAAAAAVKNATDQATGGGGQLAPNVAEVRQFTATDVAEKDPSGQTESVWVGLSSDSVTSFDAGANAARRVDVERDEKGRQAVAGVPYLTPFALGKCGLVLPRYPNTRVMIAYRRGDPHDPVDIGALWQSGHIPPKTEPGDWWLSLPARVGGTPPSSIDDTDTATNDYDGKISQDLIDGQGQRALEVTTLRIRVGADLLSDAGNRVTPAPDGTAVVIEHTKNGKSASITIKDDSSIEISSDTKITFTTQGNIEMKAANVNVHVSGRMDVAS
jgi:hypothetical protein